MKENICYVVGAGENDGIDFTPQQEDYVIAADGGWNYLEEASISANLVIGDFDSLQEKPHHANIILLKKEKDETDTFAAIQEGIAKGYRTFHLHGCTGGRIEHTLANLQLLVYLSKQKMQGFLFDEMNIMTAITNITFTLPKCASGYVSIFSHGEQSEGVTLKGLKYELDGAILTSDYPLGVSNEFIGEKSTITVEKGTLIIVYPRNLKP